MLPFFVILPMVIAVFLFLTKNNNVVMLLSVVFQFVLFVLAVWLVMETRDVDVFFNIGDYEDMMGIILRANSLSAVFVLLTTFVFLVISVFTYKDNREQRTFRFLLFVLESSLLGIFLTGDLFNIFVLVEVSTLAIVVLTMYDRERRNMYHGKVFLLANMVAIQFYLLGLGYLYRLTGSPDMGRVTELVAVMDYRNFILPYVLIMT
ncbi:MAG: hypothetical protein FWF81_01530, partial [Defluviitaleaceae bacterium]|nr:hypothetical protein [Defluviitaleaceae bacterium]